MAPEQDAMQKLWCETELQILFAKWSESTPKSISRDILEATGRVRSEKSIQLKAWRMGLSQSEPLPIEDENLIVQLLDERNKALKTAGSLSDEKIAAKFGIAKGVVRRIRRSMR